MVNLSILISTSSEVNGPGGLFDFDLTLPLVGLQFILLMLVLNSLFYTPLLKVITERNDFIVGNLSSAAKTLIEAKKLKTQYEQDMTKVRKDAKLEIVNSQKNSQRNLRY